MIYNLIQSQTIKAIAQTHLIGVVFTQHLGKIANKSKLAYFIDGYYSACTSYLKEDLKKSNLDNLDKLNFNVVLSSYINALNLSFDSSYYIGVVVAYGLFITTLKGMLTKSKNKDVLNKFNSTFHQLVSSNYFEHLRNAISGGVYE